MDLASRLLLLLEVSELGSFVKVSELRNVNRSAISKQIGKLEKELGVHLLNRTTRSLSLTAAGSEMVNQAKQLRDLLNNSKRLAENYHSEPRGELKISSSTLFGRQYVQQAVLKFQAQYPDIRIELLLEDRIVDLVGEGFDIGFRIGEPKESNLIAKQIAQNRLLIVAAPSFIEKHGKPTTIPKLESLPAVVYSAQGLLIDKIKYLDNTGNEAFIQLNTAYKVNEVEMLINTAVAGEMLTVTTAQMIENEVLEGKLIPIMTHINLADYGTFYAVYPHRNSPLKTKLFIETLKEVVGDKRPIWETRIPGFDKMYNNKT
ncbi:MULTISPECIES: LysR family transcriptional regulator [Colwellia]|uniref:Transcriptional regulator, LysR family n=1 Tax=Colwellia psychrerythraea (strain 34H / ATCC BAA-681) TaxID=167879 RepID=Q47YX4_COLP3|nr:MULTISPECIES: LysR family transcriptional regulator [Colwellia]AAZ28172.1 transcriptional regulator, LysR family [Colwellia psychrerythraea 34H]PKH87029.1 LysR family transcriptional regulator [Colwellia sp. Bg11-28]